MKPWPSRRCAEALGALAACTFTTVAAACPCGAPAGAFPAWTAPDERLTFSAMFGASTEHGSFDARGRAWPSPDGVSSHRVTADLIAAWRPAPAWELAASVAGGWSATRLPGLQAESIALGDSALRVRWESPRTTSGAAPEVALWTGLRAPTGDHDARAFGLTAAGLGHWEMSLGGELRWTLSRRWSLSVGAELGARAPARREGVEVTPGPRVAGLLLAVWRPTNPLALSLGVSAWSESPAWIDGQQDDAGWSYRLGPTVGLSWQLARALRLLATVSADPRVDHLGAGASAELRGSLGLSWSPLRD